jgi:uncharacterized protein (TIGR04255 family)
MGILMTEDGFAYPRAPITEAVIDFRVARQNAMSVDGLVPLTTRLAGDYPVIEQRRNATAMVDTWSQVPPRLDVAPVGFTARSADGLWIYNAQPDGVSISRLAPYTRWSDLRERAKFVWDAYISLNAPLAISRLGLRFINKIVFSERRVELVDQFYTRVEIAQDMPGTMSHFFFQTQIVQSDINCVAVINSTAEHRNPAANVSIILDIDLFTVSNEGIHFDNAWDKLEVMRRRKNVIFEACITEKTRGLFS